MEQTTSKKRIFTLRCENCRKVITEDFINQKDMDDLLERMLYVECKCGGRCFVLLD